ncbi:hypothetical protein Golax_024174 [Gossypium laxum]|uniref:Reverse transcriptase n=1 Tax=Gossypium laxum TaxID=34288 RepID=A0A7J8ZBW5_9ROSI|nr:hypothetical protein [Gossypium laxum]
MKKPANMDKSECDRLETFYSTKSLVNRLVLKQQLYTFHMNEGEHFRDHTSQFITLLSDLKNVEI